VATGGDKHGFTLIEVLMAVLLLSTMALALTARCSRRSGPRRSERWMQATNSR